METINYNGGYLYCSIIELPTLAQFYKNADEMYEELKADIIEECRDKYNEYELEVIFSHYYIETHNISKKHFNIRIY